MRRLWALLLLLAIFLCSAPAQALLLQETLASGDILDKSLRSLQDNHGYSWQLVAFKVDSEPRAYLRLVGFPAVTPIDHRAPLMVQTGATLTSVRDQTPDFGHEPPATVAQYPLAPILAQQSAPTAMDLSIPSQSPEGDRSSDLHIPKSVAAEWWAILDHEATTPK